MRTAIYRGKRDILLTERPLPEAGEEDIVVKNLYASICGTDVAVYFHGPGTGHKITVGEEFGHEMVFAGRAGGREVKGIRVGTGSIPIRYWPRGIPGAPGRWADSRNTWFFPMPGYMRAFIPWGRK